MKKLSLLMMCVMLGVLTILSSCSSENLLTAATEDDEVTVTVNCDSPRGWDIAKYVVTATDASGNKKTSESAVAALSITLKKGVWSFTVSERADAFRTGVPPVKRVLFAPARMGIGNRVFPGETVDNFSFLIHQQQFYGAGSQIDTDVP